MQLQLKEMALFKSKLARSSTLKTLHQRYYCCCLYFYYAVYLFFFVLFFVFHFIWKYYFDVNWMSRLQFGSCGKATRRRPASEVVNAAPRRRPARHRRNGPAWRWHRHCRREAPTSAIPRHRSVRSADGSTFPPCRRLYRAEKTSFTTSSVLLKVIF